MSFCETLQMSRVISDEIFYIEDNEFAIPIGEVRVQTGSIITGVVTVTVLELNPRIDLELNAFFADVVFMVQKELTIEPPAGAVIPLEFGFRLERTVEFRKSTPLELLAIDPDFLTDLEGYVVHVLGTDVVTLHPSTFDPVTDQFLTDATFDEELTIQLKLKLVQNRQLITSLCDPKHGVDISVTTT